MTRVLGKYERLFHERQARDLELAPSRGLHFDKAAGDWVINFVEGKCKHHEGEFAGKPFLLEPWQREIVSSAFSWLRADKTRRFRTLYIEIPRKNGKSELAAALSLYLLCADGEQGAQIFSSATKRDQAKIVWRAASLMAQSSPDLKKHMEMFKTSLTVPKTNSFFQPLSSESNTLDGLNPHGNIVDELQAHRNYDLWNVLASAMGARRQPLTLAITTAGVYDPEGIGTQMHEYAQKVLDGIYDDDSFFAFIAAADEGDDLFSEATLRKANPNYDVSVKGEYLLKQAERAQRQAGFLNEYLVKHTDTWTQQVTRWLRTDSWNACEPTLPPGTNNFTAARAREKSLEGRTAFGGLDLSSKLDLTALALVLPDKDGFIDVVCRFWLPEARVADAARKGQRFYETWAREGWLTLTPGDVVDYEFVRAEINALAKRYVIRELAFDPWAAQDLATRLAGDGVVMAECRQGFKSMSEPAKDFEARVIEKKVRHALNPVLRWCVSNAVVTSDAAGNVKPDKAKATERIDGVVAAVMAMSRVIVHRDPPESSLLLSGGLLL